MLPKSLKRFHNSGSEHSLQDWKRKLWTDADIHNLVEKYYPWFLPTWTLFPHTKNRIDSARAMMLDPSGGIYAGMDVELGGSKAFASEQILSTLLEPNPHTRCCIDGLISEAPFLDVLSEAHKHGGQCAAWARSLN